MTCIKKEHTYEPSEALRLVFISEPKSEQGSVQLMANGTSIIILREDFHQLMVAARDEGWIK